MFYDLMRLDQRLMLLCVGAIVLAVIYAHFDEQFADALTWTRRSLHYDNQVVLACPSTGPCNAVYWDAHKATNLSSTAFKVHFQDQTFNASQLGNESYLRAKGWKEEGWTDPSSGVINLSSPGGWNQGPQSVRTTIKNGQVQEVWVSASETLYVTTQGRRVPLPVSRSEVTKTWGPPAKIVRINAINGPIPD